MKEFIRQATQFTVRPESFLTPITAILITNHKTGVTGRHLYIFGIRVAYWTVVLK